ncbi:hypothetical protein STAL104432_24250 [Streptomyces albus]
MIHCRQPMHRIDAGSVIEYGCAACGHQELVFR